MPSHGNPPSPPPLPSSNSSCTAQILARRSVILIRFDGGQNATIRATISILNAFPDCQSLILLPSRREVSRFERKLSDAGLSVGEPGTAALPSTCPRPATLRTYADHRTFEFEPRAKSLLVFPDALSAIRSVNREMLLEVQTSDTAVRTVALLPSRQTLSPLERDQISQTFGTLWFDLDANGDVLPGVGVVTQPYRSATLRDLPCDDLAAAMREGILQDPSRNRSVANLAAAVRSIPSSLEGTPDFPPVVLAANDCHVVRLRRSLGNIPATVVTSDDLGGVGIPGGVLIRADGGVDLPPGLTAAVRATCRRRELVVIDLEDCHHRLFRDRSRRRREAYARERWAMGPGEREGGAAFFLERTRRMAYTYNGNRVLAQTRRRTSQRWGGAPPTLEQLGGVEYLIAVFRSMRSCNGPAPGPDGIGPRGVGTSEMAVLLREEGPRISANRWSPGPCRSVRIPTSSGGVRELKLANLCDRVVFKAAAEMLSPFWEPRFRDCSHAYRPNRSRWTALASVAVAVERTGATVLTVDDIATAFDSLEIRAILDAHASAIVDAPQLLEFLGRILRGADGRTRGIAQGNAYSPLALHVLLDRDHDRPLSGLAGDGLLHCVRFADDLAYLTETEGRGRGPKLGELPACPIGVVAQRAWRAARSPERIRRSARPEVECRGRPTGLPF